MYVGGCIMTKNRSFILLFLFLSLSKYLLCQGSAGVYPAKESSTVLTKATTIPFYEFDYNKTSQNDCSDVVPGVEWGTQKLKLTTDNRETVCRHLVYYDDNNGDKCFNDDVCSYYKDQFDRLSKVDDKVLAQMRLPRDAFNSKYRSVRACTWQNHKCVSANSVALDTSSASDVMRTEFLDLVTKKDQALSEFIESIKKYRNLTDDKTTVSDEITKYYTVTDAQV